ncbi:5589_t:CDS:2 [Cetraspora pellucida]|uniref:5589_t:CDS:1 n=1 Tax=Cetraspora pellucida TaxID=1433469 RepID=A0A9N9BYQ4_9GLOM|nr:5589_t:CDS:2 [Cetraspora pellucida]
MFSKKHFVFTDIPDLSGKVAIVTGGNNGIGFITSRELTRKNAHVFVASRSKERVNNAGIITTTFEQTQDGIQDHFGVNHIGHFLFTLLLLPTIKASAPSRIVNVSSYGHNIVPSDGIEFDKLNDPNAHTTLERYGQSKLANILFTLELNKKLSGTKVYYLTHKLVNNWSSWIKPIFFVSKLFLLTPDDGALTQLYCATSPEIEENNYRGKYFIPFGELGETSDHAKNEELAKKLWHFSETFVKEKLGYDVFNKCYA